LRNLTKRISHLERLSKTGSQAEEQEALAALSDGQLDWLLEPIDEGQSSVPCPHVESIECGCRSDGRLRRAIEVYPELLAEYLRRQGVLDEAVRSSEH
jgi:hypothetical protein